LTHKINVDQLLQFIDSMGKNYRWKTKEGKTFFAWVEQFDIHYKPEKGKTYKTSSSAVKKFVDAWNILGEDAKTTQYRELVGRGQGTSYIPPLMSECARHLRSKTSNSLKLQNNSETILPDGNTEPSRHDSYFHRIIRDTDLIRKIKKLHNYRCQICGQTIELSNKDRYSEAHHIQSLGKPHDGPDVPGNIIILCPNHHVQCDYGAISLDISQLNMVHEHTLQKKYIDYHNDIICKKG
jgi:hypothetical protein